MNYIVFDLEWNQCPYGKGQENERIPFEIIEIGAVKLNSERQIIDQYQVLIQPRVYKKLHHRTREIIQMDMKLLEREGIPFYRAVKEFLKWCGEDALFCSWGNSDLLELQRNMKYYGVLQLLKGPIRYLDVQKLFSIDRRTETAEGLWSMPWMYWRLKNSRNFTGHWRIPGIRQRF